MERSVIPASNVSKHLKLGFHCIPSQPTMLTWEFQLLSAASAMPLNHRLIQIRIRNRNNDPLFHNDSIDLFMENYLRFYCEIE